MNLAEELSARGLLEHSSAEPKNILGKQRTVYLGIDPTADSMQIGNLAVVLLMRRLGEAGNKLVFLVGGGTGMIGDPKEKGERVLLDEKTLARNTKALKTQLKKLLPGISFRLVDNADWLSKVRLVPFLRDIGKHFTVNDLIKRDLIARRLNTPDESISYTEFTYALLQGYDYLILNDKYNVDLQIGGSDQWTNILSGVELVRKRTGKEVYALSMPLVTDASGKKFGKSEGNAVWVDAKKTSPFTFYQFWINLPDDGIEKYLKAYTFLPLSEIEAIMERQRANPGSRVAQQTLARLVTSVVHGAETAKNVAAATDVLFGSRTMANLTREEQATALEAAPTQLVSARDLTAGYALIDALALGNLVSSKSEARRLIESKGISLNGKVVEAPDHKLAATDFTDGYAIARKGKRDVLILKLS